MFGPSDAWDFLTPDQQKMIEENDMPMGDSGGRSNGNRTAEGARRRNTPRERAGIDPPWDEKVPHYVLTERGNRMLALAAFVAGVVASALFALIVAAWFGLL